MTYEDVARQLVDHLNSQKEPDKFNGGILTYKLEHLFSGFSLKCHHAAICCYGRVLRYGRVLLCYTSVFDKCVNFDEACERMLKRYFNGKISFSSPEELSLKMTIRGMM